MLLNASTIALPVQELAVSAKDVAAGGALPTARDPARDRTYRQQVDPRSSRAQWPGPCGGGAQGLMRALRAGSLCVAAWYCKLRAGAAWCERKLIDVDWVSSAASYREAECQNSCIVVCKVERCSYKTRAPFGQSNAAKKRSSYRPCLLQPSHVCNLGPVLKNAQCRERGLQHATAACARPSGPASKLSAGHRAAVQHRVLGLDVIPVRNGPASGDRTLSSAWSSQLSRKPRSRSVCGGNAATTQPLMIPGKHLSQARADNCCMWACPHQG